MTLMNRAGMSIEGHKRVDMNLRQSKNRGGESHEDDQDLWYEPV